MCELFGVTKYRHARQGQLWLGQEINITDFGWLRWLQIYQSRSESIKFSQDVERPAKSLVLVQGSRWHCLERDPESGYLLPASLSFRLGTKFVIDWCNQNLSWNDSIDIWTGKQLPTFFAITL